MNLKGIAVRAGRAGVAFAQPDSQTVTGSMNFTVLAAAPVDPTVGSTVPPQSPVVATRWQLDDPVTGEVFSFPINPKNADSPEYGRTINEKMTTTGQPVTNEGSRVVPMWTIGGHVSTQAMHDALIHWSRKTNKIYITDDLARTWAVYIKEYTHIPRLGYAIWEGTWSMKLLVFDQVVF